MTSINDNYQFNNQPKIYIKSINSNNNSTNLIENKFYKLINDLHKSEQTGIMAASNKTDLSTLVTNFSEIEVNLKAFVTILEKLMASLQEIIKFPV